MENSLGGGLIRSCLIWSPEATTRVASALTNGDSVESSDEGFLVGIL